MIVGVPKEIKSDEYRVALTPHGAEELIKRGHRVVVETQAGAGCGFPDDAYMKAGAEILPSPEAVFGQAELIAKVKEPQPSELALLNEKHLLFTYLHLAASRELTEGLLASKTAAIAYETVRTSEGRLPLLEPMSQIAGKMAPLAGSYFLGRFHGGAGVLPGGAAGVLPAKVTVIGAGMVGLNAALVAAGTGADVVIMDLSGKRMQEIEPILPANIRTRYATPATVREQLALSQMVILAAMVPGGAKAPTLVRREDLALMPEGAVIVDVAIDQGGCAETSRPTTHHDPVYTIDGVVHYCVANMPGAYPATATLALTGATFPYLLELAEKGWETACRENPSLAAGLTAAGGTLACPAVAETFGLPITNPLA